MKKYEKLLIWVAVLAILAFVMVSNWDLVAAQINKSKGANPSPDGSLSMTPTGGTKSTPANTTPAPGSNALDWNKVLGSGVNSPEVNLLQQWLNQVQPTGLLLVDGKFGPKTAAKLKALTGKTSITLYQAYQLMLQALTNMN